MPEITCRAKPLVATQALSSGVTRSMTRVGIVLVTESTVQGMRTVHPNGTFLGSLMEGRE
jgi:hypothetical protein